MAQEHTLKLKAVLDTSDIQAKLNRLNGQQSQAQQAGTSRGAPGGIAQGINNVLLRLNNTLTQLNQSIVRMNQGIGRMNTANATHATSQNAGQPANAFTGKFIRSAGAMVDSVAAYNSGYMK